MMDAILGAPTAAFIEETVPTVDTASHTHIGARIDPPLSHCRPSQQKRAEHILGARINPVTLQPPPTT